MRDNGEEFFDDADYWDYAYNFGLRLKIRPYIWCYGFIKAIEMLSKEQTNEN